MKNKLIYVLYIGKGFSRKWDAGTLTLSPMFWWFSNRMIFITATNPTPNQNVLVQWFLWLASWQLFNFRHKSRSMQKNSQYRHTLSWSPLIIGWANNICDWFKECHQLHEVKTVHEVCHVILQTYQICPNKSL